MKTIKKGKEILRVGDERAAELVKDKGYVYCPKSEYKNKKKEK